MATPISPARLCIIKIDYELGVFDNSQIAQKHGCHKSTVERLAQRHGWTRSAAGKVRDGIRAGLITQRTDSSPPAAEALQVAVATGLALITQHRGTLAKLRAVSDTILDEFHVLEGEMIKQFPGMSPADRVKTRGFLIREKANLVNTIASAASKFIPLERQAFNLDAAAGDEDEPAAIMIGDYRDPGAAPLPDIEEKPAQLPAP